MSTSLIQFFGRAVGALLLFAAGGVVYWQLQPIDWTQTSSNKLSSSPRVQRLPKIPTADSLAKLAEQRLRAPLYDPPPERKPPPKKPKPPPPPRVNLRLVGTIIEKDRSRAVLTAPSGRTEIRGEGEQVRSVPGEIVVAGVSADRVILKVGSANDAEVTLTLEGKGGN